MKHISNKRINSVMSFLLANPNITDDDFSNFANTKDNLIYLGYLKAMEAIDYKFAFNRERLPHLYCLRILNKGTLFFYNKQQERVGFWKGFISGFLIAILSAIIGYILPILFK